VQFGKVLTQKKKPTLKLDGKKVIVENVSVYDASIPMSSIISVMKMRMQSIITKKDK
jgi:hypothetical protein